MCRRHTAGRDGVEGGREGGREEGGREGGREGGISLWRDRGRDA